MTLADLIARHGGDFAPLFDPALTPANTIGLEPGDGAAITALEAGAAGDEAIFARIAASGAIAAAGGYLERRSVYRDTDLFRGDAERCIHIGVDVVMPPGTQILAPLAGEVHGFANRRVQGDYGPVIILRHELDRVAFHSLYGHLSVESLDGLAAGMRIAAGARLGAVGERAVNGGWVPHLHFQLIEDMQGMVDDYPGVVRADEVEFYRRNCPDPMALLVRSGQDARQ